ncbi:hypothetical protein SOCE26_098280 [Sorangium cellulosum]|uniref:Uncharacterized protein n=1 Tax=Sorangium cellulosum TaxID=56 RepID=A0A2L0F9M8_SORCE|nr:hypothetical protein SOCE26_098280 [Sorangium cellulosum]
MTAALLAASGAAAVGLAEGALPAWRDSPLALGAASGLAAGAALLLLCGELRRERRAARAARAAEEADAPPPGRPRRRAARPAARAALAPPSRRDDPRAIYAYAAHVIGQSLAWEGNYKAAAASLRDVPPDWIPPRVRMLAWSHLAQWQLCAGDLEGARRLLEVLDEARAPADVRPHVRGARAAVLVRTGAGEEALALVGRIDGQRGEPPEVRQRYRITRAHALAARGERAAARAELRRVVDDVGVDELCRWLPAGGPARAAMIEVIDEG